MIRTALVGCGHIARQHLTLLRTLPGIEVVALCDLDRSRAAALAGSFGISSVFNDLGAMIASAAPDVVHVLTPPHTHRAVVEQLLPSGAAVLVEKPLAASATDTLAMLQSAQASGTRLNVCHNYLFQSGVRRALQLIRAGRLGSIASVDGYWRVTSLEGDCRREAQCWLGQLPGGAFHEVAPHAIYLLQALLGDLQVVEARQHGDASGPRELRMLLAAGERLASMTISLDSLPVQKYLRIHGSRMSLHVDLATNMLLCLRPFGAGAVGRALLNLDQARQIVAATGGNTLRTLLGRMPRTHREFLRTYYRALRRGDDLPVGAEQGHAVAQTLDAVWGALV